MWIFEWIDQFLSQKWGGFRWTFDVWWLFFTLNFQKHLKKTLKSSFVNEDGSLEEWGGGMTEEELVQKIDEGFDKFKNDFIDKLKNESSAD